MSETLFPALTVSLAAIAFFAGWFAHRRRYLDRMSRLRADQERRDVLNLGRLADARRQAASTMTENSVLKSEIAHQRARLLRARSFPAPMVEPTILRTPVEKAPDRRPPEDANEFQDTQPWEPGSA